MALNNENTKIGIVSTFTLNKLPQILEDISRKEGISIRARSYTSYNLCIDEICNKASDLNQLKPDILFLFIDLKAYLPDYLRIVNKTGEDKNKIIAEGVEHIKRLIAVFIENHPRSTVVVHNFEIPTYSPLGILDKKVEMGLKDCIRLLNIKIEKELRNEKKVYVFDYDGFLGKHGKKKSCDPRFYYIADMKLNDAMVAELAKEYAAYIKPMKSMFRKCIVVDLDNTLWGGIVGEDGFDKIKIGPTPPGNVYVDFQKVILSLFEKGVLLAVNSKNNAEEALKVIREHPYMVLREEHFSAMKINWQDKAANMKEIAEELNIGMDSIVFVDDDNLNRLRVKSAFPEVLVVNMPEDPSFFAETMMELNEFNTLQLTEDDKSRGRLYAEERQRKELKSKFSDMTEFLRSLQMKVEIEEASSFTIPRISQLTNKTNQFNLTTKRYSEADIERFKEDKEYYVCSIKASDKLGDNGIVGCSILKMQGEEGIIDTFLLSCRIIGREIEKALLNHVIEKAKSLGARKVVGEYIPTKKNAQTANLFKNEGFSLIGKKEDGYSRWMIELSKYKVIYPDFIEVRHEASVNAK